MSHETPNHFEATSDPSTSSASTEPSSSTTQEYSTSSSETPMATSGQQEQRSDLGDENVRRGSGTLEPLSLTAASDRIDQKNEPYAEHRGSLSQNAPGKAGDVGEAAVGLLGFGGTAVERPKEDQGTGRADSKILGSVKASRRW